MKVQDLSIETPPSFLSASRLDVKSYLNRPSQRTVKCLLILLGIAAPSFNVLEAQVEFSLDYNQTIAEDEAGGGVILCPDPGALTNNPFSIAPENQGDNGIALLTPGAAGEAFWSYTPIPNYFGTDTFAITIIDTTGLTTEALVTYTILPENDPSTIGISSDLHTACNDELLALLADETYGISPCTIDEEEVHQFSLTVQDTDGTPSNAIQVSSTPSNGVLEQIPGGTSHSTWQYAPAPDFAGNDAFMLSVTDSSGYSIQLEFNMEVESVDDGPSESSETVLVAYEDSSTQHTIVFSDPEGVSEGDVLLLNSDHGTSNIISTSQQNQHLEVVISYLPTVDYSGADSLRLSVIDGQGFMTDLAIPIEVIPTNDPSILIEGDLSAAIDEDTEASGILVLSDSDGYSAGFASVSTINSPSNGMVSIEENGEGQLSWGYNPNSDFFGNDAFDIRFKCLGNATPYTVEIIINEIDDPFSIAFGTSESELSSTDASEVTNMSAASEFSMLEGDTQDLYLHVSDNADGFVLVSGLTMSVLPQHGTLSAAGSPGAWSFVADSGYAGMDSFVLTMTDDLGHSATWTFTITIDAVDDGPASSLNTSFNIQEDSEDNVMPSPCGP